MITNALSAVKDIDSKTQHGNVGLVERVVQHFVLAVADRSIRFTSEETRRTSACRCLAAVGAHAHHEA